MARAGPIPGGMERVITHIGRALRPRPACRARSRRHAWGRWLAGFALSLLAAGAQAEAAADGAAPAAAEAAEAVGATARGDTGGSAAAAAADPMTQLKHRLQELLDARPAGDARGTHEIELPLRRHAAAPSRVQRAAAGAADARPGARRWGEPAWGYGDDDGPARWGALDPAWSLCAHGRRQSPIDLRDGIAVDLHPVRFDYRPGGFRVVDSGRTVRVDVDPGSAIELGGRRYALQQLEFRRPSEERIEGRQFEMSVQMLHRDTDGRLAVVAVVLEEGPALPLVQQVWADLPLERHAPATGHGRIDPSGLLPEARGYYAYLGSLTTPPCTEGVLWIVMQQPMTASRAQIDIFARLYPMNARPLQDAAGRLIKQSVRVD